MLSNQVNFGLFFPPLHPVGQSPTLALESDLQRTVRADQLGYDEAWFGEHHSSGYELIGSPEIMIAFAAERTRQIKLGTGVISLPYHNPFMVAARLLMLDHLTRGRMMFGAGPGALQSDQYMLNIEPADTRRRMNESLEAILHLLRSEEPLTMETDWFSLRDAKLQMAPYSDFEIAVAAMVSPSGPTTAGRLGLSLLSFGGLIADPKHQAGHAALKTAWETVEKAAKATDNLDNVSRRGWRVALPVHIAETAKQAEEDVRWGLGAFAAIYREGQEGLVPLKGQSVDSLIKRFRDGRMALVGTPDDLVAHIEDLQEISGGFGTVLFVAHDWADPEATRKSDELIARHVIPHFKGQLARPIASHNWINDVRPQLWEKSKAALAKAETQFDPERVSA